MENNIICERLDGQSVIIYRMNQRLRMQDYELRKLRKELRNLKDNVYNKNHRIIKKI